MGGIEGTQSSYRNSGTASILHLEWKGPTESLEIIYHFIREMKDDGMRLNRAWFPAYQLILKKTHAAEERGASKHDDV